MVKTNSQRSEGKVRDGHATAGIRRKYAFIDVEFYVSGKHFSFMVQTPLKPPAMHPGRSADACAFPARRIGPLFKAHKCNY